jgi:calcium-dependent protein kinase
VWSEITTDAKDLISKMLSKEDVRPSAAECLNHPWFTSQIRSELTISIKTVERLRSFSYINTLKRAILLFIAYHSNSKEEIQKQKRIFLSIDLKKNGYVSFEDIRGLLQNHLDEADIVKVFSSIDADGNGKIFWNEFLAATISQSIYLKEENLKEAFNYLDKEKKEYFGLQDLKVVLSDPEI